jgi:hypothetical protein
MWGERSRRKQPASGAGAGRRIAQRASDVDTNVHAYQHAHAPPHAHTQAETPTDCFAPSAARAGENSYAHTQPITHAYPWHWRIGHANVHARRSGNPYPYAYAYSAALPDLYRPWRVNDAGERRARHSGGNRVLV